MKTPTFESMWKEFEDKTLGGEENELYPGQTLHHKMTFYTGAYVLFGLVAGQTADKDMPQEEKMKYIDSVFQELDNFLSAMAAEADAHEQMQKALNDDEPEAA